MKKLRSAQNFRNAAQVSAALALSLSMTGLPSASAQDGAPPAAVNNDKQDASSASAQKPKADEAMLNFVGADIESVVKAIGHYTGHTFIIDPRVKGTITVVSEKPVTKQQAFNLLTSALRLQGFAVVVSGGLSKVVPEADAKLQAGPTQVRSVKGDQVATEIYRLNYESAPNLVGVLRPLISPNNTINADPGTNTLVITDYADNLERMGKIIAALDGPQNGDVDIVPIRYAIASDIATMVNRLMEPGPGGDMARVTVLADARTNSVILRAGSAARINLAKSLIDKLDLPSKEPGNVHVVYLRNANAIKLAQTLRAVISGEGSTGGQQQGGLSNTGLNSGNNNNNNNGGQNTGMGGGMQPQLSSGNQPVLSAGGAGGFIQADPETNTLIISASEAVYRNIRAVIDQLDARRAQVYIEAMIVEITSSKAAELGVQWAGLSGNVRSAYRVGTLTSFSSGGANLVNLAAGALAGGSGTTGGTSFTPPKNGINLGIFKQENGLLTLGALARALETDTNANILSMPNLITLDNEEAKIVVGQNVPFVTGQYAGSSGVGATVNPFQTIERKDVGLSLNVRPQISQGGTIKMAIYQETSNVNATSNASDIITDKRSIQTNVLADDGQVIVLGGLIDDNGNDNAEEVPVLSKIPLLGNLFKYRTRQHTKRNLMVFLRPTIIRSSDQSVNLSADRYAYMNDVQGAALPEHTIILPNVGLQRLPQMQDGQLVNGPMYKKPPSDPALKDAQPAAVQPVYPQTEGVQTPPAQPTQ